MFAGWSRDDSAFYVLTNERDPRFFDVYRYEAERTSGRTLVYEDKEGYQVGDVSGDGRWIALDEAEDHRRQRHLPLGRPVRRDDPPHAPQAARPVRGRPSSTPTRSGSTT